MGNHITLGVTVVQRRFEDLHALTSDGGTPKKPDQLLGRNDNNKIVVFPDNGAGAGEFVNVRIDEVTPNTLIGESVD